MDVPWMKMLQKGAPISVIDLAHSNRSCGRHIGGIISARRTVAFNDRTWFQPDLDRSGRRLTSGAATDCTQSSEAARNRCSVSAPEHAARSHRIVAHAGADGRATPRIAHEKARRYGCNWKIETTLLT